MRLFINYYNRVCIFLRNYGEKSQFNQYRLAFVVSLFINTFIESINQGNIVKVVPYVLTNPMVFITNTIIVFFMCCIALCLKRKYFAMFMVSAFWISQGVIDFVLLRIRTTPLSPTDYALILSCLPVIKKYLSAFNIILLVILVVLLIVQIGIMFLHSKIYKGSLKQSLAVAAIAGALVALAIFSCFKLDMLSNRFPNLADAYKQYGFVYCYSLDIFTSGVAEPDNYSEASVDDALEDINESEEEAQDHAWSSRLTAEAKNANIIFLQLESFFDVNRLKDISFSENPVEVFDSLKATCPSGFLRVPSVGAGTANVEFEIMSGMSLEYFSGGEYPYKTILKDSTCESVCYNLKENGYTAHGIHNNGATFYNRNTVFKSLGFDTFTSLEYMNDVTYNPLGWAKDECLTKCIFDCLESTEGRDCIYTISVQPHGGYPEENEDENLFDTFGLEDNADENKEQNSKTDNKAGHKAENIDVDEEEVKRGHTSGNIIATLTEEEIQAQTIKVEGIDDPDLKSQYAYYVNQIEEVDEFLGTLVTELSSYEEPVMLIVYGDHLPALYISDDMLNDGSSILDSEYVIWSNFEMNWIDQNLTAYQLSSEVLKLMDIHNGVLTKLHQFERNTSDYQKSLELFEYDMLYGDSFSWEGKGYPFTNIVMGVKPITINSTFNIGNKFYINGLNFTEFSQISINGELQDTEFKNSTTISCQGTRLKKGDSITVCQVAETGEVLSASKTFRI